jgi:hypothetical protein
MEVTHLGFQAFLDIAVVALRFLLPVYAVVIIYQCFASMRRHRRPEKPLVTLELRETGEQIPVLFWENSIGRSKGSDICVDDPTVSRDHCVLLRRQEGWMVSDIGSKGGTYVNGKKVRDGWFSDNVPVNLALELGAEKIFAIDIMWGINKKVAKDVNIYYLRPSKKMKFFLNFSNDVVRDAIELGYNDVMNKKEEILNFLNN